MNRPALRLATLALSLLAAPLLLAADLGQITHLRVGGHRGYDRVVIEVDRAVKVWWGVESDPRSPIFELSARPLRPQVLDTGLNRAGVMRIEAMPQGTRIHFDPRARRVRVFTLKDPHRVVIDLADASSKPFTSPKGTNSIRMGQERFSASAGTSTPTAKPAAETAKPVAETAKPVAETAKPVAEKTKPVAETAKPVARTEQRSPFDAPKGAPQPTPAPRTAKAQPAPGPAEQPGVAPIKRPASSEQTEPPAEIAGATSTQGAASAPVKPPRPVPGAASGEPPDWWLLLAAAFGLVAVACLIYGIVSRPSAAAPEDANDIYSMSSPETITPEELFREGGRIELLDKRVDEEVRARMLLEERVVQANEELKVLRDKLVRLERRR